MIDVKRARMGGIRPIPERVEQTSAGPVARADLAPRDPIIPDASTFAPTGAGRSIPRKHTETPGSRLDRWRRKLLDLSLRNRLLNFRETKKTIPLLCADVYALEDALADGNVFQVRPRFADYGDGDPRSAAVQRDSADVVVASKKAPQVNQRRR